MSRRALRVRTRRLGGFSQESDRGVADGVTVRWYLIALWGADILRPALRIADRHGWPAGAGLTSFNILLHNNMC